MVHVDCRQVTKHYGEQVVLDRLNWTIEAGQSWGLVGPSGAGKTTLLRILAGLEKGNAGEISYLDTNQCLVRRPRVGMVFQQLGLWPHLTASQHLECVVSDGSRQGRRQIAAERLAEVRLPASCRDKRPEQLSGGELQRLAIARALAVEPQILLFDEPLAQVDTPLRAELITLLRELISRRNITSIYVTHSWVEASQVAEQVAVLLDRKLIQSGRFADVYRNPVSPTVARLTGPIVEIPCRAAEDGRICLTECLATMSMQGDPWLVRPQQIELIASDGRNRWEVMQCRPCGFAWIAVFASGDEKISAAICRKVCPGDVVGLKISELLE